MERWSPSKGTTVSDPCTNSGIIQKERCRMAQRLEIVNGPSKFDLMTSLFHGKTEDQHRQVQFEVKDADGRKASKAVTIGGVEREDGSGESWLIHGYMMVVNVPWRRITGYYSSRTRKGWIEES